MSYSPCNCDDLDCRECGLHNREKMVARVRGMAAFINIKQPNYIWYDSRKVEPSSVNEDNALAIEAQIKPIALAIAGDIYTAECEAARKEAIERTLRKQCALFAESMT